MTSRDDRFRPTIQGEPADGMLIGRAHNMAEWQFRRDAKAFRRLERALVTRRWRMRATARGRDLVREAIGREG